MRIARPARLLRLSALLAAGTLTVASAIASTPIQAAASGAAPGGPGSLSHFDVARKDCFGTARNTTSKVWYTVAQGVLSDVYFPTLDNTNVETLRIVVTDGSTFTDLQGRDTTYTVSAPDPRALSCEVTTTAKSGRWRLITDYLTDTERNTVVMRNRFQALSGKPTDYQLYVRFDPTVNGNGGGSPDNGGGDTALTDTSAGHPVAVAYDTSTNSNAANRDYAVPVFAALDSSRGFQQVSSGFAGAASDGLTQLDTAHSLTATYDSAANGNVVQVAQLGSGSSPFSLGLGFGTSQASAVAAAVGSLAADWNDLSDAYREGWATYDDTLREPPGHFGGMGTSAWHQLVDAYYYNANVLKASEDKTFPGAISAGAASPWGQAVSAGDPNNLYFGSYREVFARDLYEAWTGLMADGDIATARAAVSFLFQRQQLPDGSMPRNSLLNGKVAPDSFNTQLDEASYPILMADLLNMSDHALYLNHVRPAAAFVMAHGPSFGVERWEEQSGFSPSTIAAEIAGLVAAAHLAQANGDGDFAAVCRGVADDWQRSIKGWTLTTNGPLANHPYFIRLSKSGDPNAAISYNVGNGGPTLDQRTVIDAGFLEYVRLGLLPATDPDILQSLPVVDTTIRSTTATGPGWHRYNGDGYGDGAADGHPWAPSGKGTGHLWPVLTGERGEQQLAQGDRTGALALLQAIHDQASGVGLIPEQVWEQPDLAASPWGADPTVASIGFQNGKPAGSASPLTWSAGAYVRLLRDIVTGSLLDRPRATYDRYVA
ncbi:MAG: glycoside hydrolase family 15 protein, partial [Candidatus Dormibacteraeota bacterium]|nr:glycoside hydrolase family 15 protein [Candidatus Dormibacteraeota bacterium]